jgi:hypothetical protein
LLSDAPYTSLKLQNNEFILLRRVITFDNITANTHENKKRTQQNKQ